MDSTTGGDANDEFARWLAETAREQQEAAPAQPQPQPQAPGAPAGGVPASPPPSFPPPAGPAPDSATYPAPSQFPPPAPEFFGADQLAAPPAPPAEQYPSGPPVARSSYQPPSSPQPASPYGVEPPATPEPAPNPFFPSSPGSDASWAPPPADPAPTDGAWSLDGPPAAPATELPTQAYEPPAPTFQPPAYEPPVTAAAFPAVQLPPAEPAPIPGPADAGQVPPADPYGALFQDPSDTAARLASAPPPSPVAPPPLVAPVSEPVPADEDPMKALFGLETEEQPAIRVAEPDPAPEPEQAYVSEPVYTPEPSFVPEPSYPPEPTFVPEPSYAPEPTYAAEPPTASYAEPQFATAGAASAAPAAAFSPAPPSDDDPTAGTQFFGGGSGDIEEPPDLDRATTAEKVGLALAVVLPPVGLVASIVNAVQSSRERGWVHRLVRISLVVAVIMSVVAGFAGAYLYKLADDARKHDQLAAASTQFCATVEADPSMVAPPTFGFPTPAATIPDTITAFQAYVDKWTALAKVAPSGIRPDVNRVVDTAQTILDQVTSTRLVDNDVNQQQMSSVAGSTNIIGWDQEYCG